MKWMSVVIALLGCAAGFVAAYYWHKSTKIRAQTTQPSARTFEKAALGLSAGLLQAYNDASHLYAIAAHWTAASVLLSGLSAVLGAFSS